MSLQTRGPATGRRRRLLATGAAVVLAVATLATGPSAAGAPLAIQPNVDLKVYDALAADDTAEVIVYLTKQADLSEAEDKGSKEEKGQYVYETLTQLADESQRDLRTMLETKGATHESFWIVNALLVEADAGLIEELSRHEDVSHIELNEDVPLLQPVADDAAVADLTVETDNSIQAVEWGVADIKADQVWANYNIRGAGVVVASIDTGVRFTHTALVNQYRGNLGGGMFDHNYNWFDPTGICGNTPCDNNNHGTHVTGTMVGDDGSSNQIGVAPGAQWIAAKGCGTSSCATAHLLAAGQWMVAPTDLNLQNPDPTKAPDIVNNSWGGGQGNTWYQATIQAWTAAGIYPVFAIGNSGFGGCGTANSPGDNIPAYGVGAYDINGAIAGFSSRGPSVIHPAIIKPNVSAPGVSVRSSIATSDTAYANFSGTSMAAPHAAGTIALMWSAAPWLKGFVAATWSILDSTARDTPDLSCGGTPGNNNVYGQGRLDALGAASWLLGPVARFAWTCNNATLLCSFNGIGSVGHIATWQWDFGDGATGGGPVISHTYGAPGTYTVTLTVTDVNGQANATSQPVPVGLVADFVHVCVPLTGYLVCGFDGAPSGPAPVVSYKWDFGDGSTAAGVAQAHLYQPPGIYQVTLTVTDAAGFSASVTKPVP